MPRTPNTPNITISTLLAVCGTLLSSHALAQTLNWVNTSGGAASISGNWSPAAVPNSANALVWNLNNTYTTTFNNLTTASLSHTYKRGTVSLNMSTPHTTGNFITADLAGETATTRLTSGILSSTGFITVANAATSVGTLTISGGSTNVSTTGTGDANIGNGGNATLNVLSGGLFTVADQFLAGNNSTSTTSVNISGEQAGVRVSTLNVTGTGESRIGSGGDVTMLIDAAAIASFAGNVVIANGSASISSVRLQSTGLRSQMNVSGSLSIGRNTGGAAAGDGSVFVDTGGSLNVTGVVNLGNDPEGGFGLLRVSGGNPTAQIGGLNIGTGGVLEHFDGSFTIQGPITVPASYQLMLPSPGAPANVSPILTMRNSSSYSSTGATSIGISPGNNAFFTIDDFSSFHQSGSNFSIGTTATASGSVVVSSGASLQVDAGLYVGAGGTAQLQLLGSAPVTCRDMDIARTTSSNGLVSVNGSTLNITEDLVVGGSSNGAGGFNSGGVGTLIIRSGGVVNTPAGRLAAVATNGTLRVIGGTLNIGGSLMCTGTFSLQGGTINSTSIECYGDCTATGTINARMFSGLPVTLTGPLVLGNSAANSIDRIPLTINTHTLTCVDPDTAVIADTNIAGGAINAVNGLRLFGGKSLTGFGTINNAFENLGTVTATTTAGLNFTGNVTSTSGQLGGTRLHFASGSTYTGRNVTGGAKWHADSGTTLTFTAGTSSVGDNSTDGLVTNGDIDILGTLIVNDTGGLLLGPTTTLRGGSLSYMSSPLTIGRTGTTRHVFRGTGTLVATTNNSGTISPGLDEADRTGTLTIVGFYSQSVTGDSGGLVMDLDGTSAASHDTLQLNGGGAVDGTLRLRVGFSPSNGTRIPIILRGGTNTILTGTFDEVVAPFGWAIDYRTDSIDAVFCASDYNADAVGDLFDYLDFVSDFSSNNPRADFNSDEVIDFFDYLDFVAAFSAGC